MRSTSQRIEGTGGQSFRMQGFDGERGNWRGILQPSGVCMQRHHLSGAILPAKRRWSGSRARCICPRRHLRVLPTRTRPSLFGGD
jgi:hypothetical protein